MTRTVTLLVSLVGAFIFSFVLGLIGLNRPDFLFLFLATIYPLWRLADNLRPFDGFFLVLVALALSFAGVTWCAVYFQRPWLAPCFVFVVVVWFFTFLPQSAFSVEIFFLLPLLTAVPVSIVTYCIASLLVFGAVPWFVSVPILLVFVLLLALARWATSRYELTWRDIFVWGGYALTVCVFWYWFLLTAPVKTTSIQPLL